MGDFPGVTVDWSKKDLGYSHCNAITNLTSLYYNGTSMSKDAGYNANSSWENYSMLGEYKTTEHLFF
jgi:hypothetical protein